MAYTSQFPVRSFLDVDGKPLENGYIWIGVAGLDPVANPTNVYWDEAATQLAVQPIRTIGGFPSNSGVRSRLYVAATDYSIKVTNVNGTDTVPVSLYNAEDAYAADIIFLQAGAGAVPRTVESKLRDTVSVKDFGAVGDGVADDTVAIQNAMAASAGEIIIFNPGTYRVTGTIIIPAKTTVLGNKATIIAASQIKVFDITSSVTISNLTIEGPSGTYASGGIAIYGSGTRNAVGVAPTYITDITIENCQIRNFGNAAIELNFVRSCLITGNTMSTLGYAGVFIYSGIDVYVTNNNVNTLTGETVSGQLNAYGITFTSLSNTTDFVRDPTSQRCRAVSNVIRDVPTWHALDTHGGAYCEFIDNEMINCRRGVILTNLNTIGAYACLVQGNTMRNILSGTNSNGSNKQGEAIWDIGPSAAIRNSRNRITGNSTYQNGDPTATSAAIWIENANEGSVDNNWLDEPFTNGILIRSNVQRYSVSQNIIVDPKGPGIAGGGPTDFPAGINFNGADFYTVDVVGNTIARKNAAAATKVAEIGIITSNTALKSIYLNDNSFQSVVSDFFLPNLTGLTGALYGSFTATLTGLTTTPTFTVKYSISGKSVVLSWDTSTTGTSNTNAMTFTGMPAFLAPSSTVYAITRVTDNGVSEFGVALVNNAALVTFFRGATLNAFTAAGTKGLPQGSISYLLV